MGGWFSWNRMMGQLTGGELALRVICRPNKPAASFSGTQPGDWDGLVIAYGFPLRRPKSLPVPPDSVEEIVAVTGLGELAEEHGYEVVPTGESLAAALTAGVVHQPGETAPVDEGKEWAEEAGGGYIHLRPSRPGCVWVIISPRRGGRLSPVFWTLVSRYRSWRR